MQNIQKILQQKPKLIGLSQYVRQQEILTDTSVPEYPQEEKEFSLGMEEHFTYKKNPNRFHRPPESDIADNVSPRQTKNIQLEAQPKKASLVIEEIQEQENHKAIDYLEEQEKTRLFLIDTLSAELSRLDQQSSKLEEFFEENQKLFNQLYNENQDIEETVKNLVKQTQLQERLKQLDKIAGTEITNIVKGKTDEDNVELNRFLEDFYEENERLFRYADKIMEDFENQSQIKQSIVYDKSMKISNALNISQYSNPDKYKNEQLNTSNDYSFTEISQDNILYKESQLILNKKNTQNSQRKFSTDKRDQYYEQFKSIDMKDQRFIFKKQQEVQTISNSQTQTKFAHNSVKTKLKSTKNIQQKKTQKNK